MVSAYLVQHKRNRYKGNREESQQRTSPADSEFLVHRPREQREPGAEGRSHEVVAGEDGSDVIRIRVGQVSEHGVEEKEGADGEESGSDNWHDPVDARPGAPSEPKETDGDEEGADHGGRETFLGLQLAVRVELGLGVLVRVPEERGDGEEGADEDAEESKTEFAETEAVDADEDDGEGLEPDVE